MRAAQFQFDPCTDAAALSEEDHDRTCSFVATRLDAEFRLAYC